MPSGVYLRTEEHRRKMGIGIKANLPSTAFKKGHIPKYKGKENKALQGDKHYCWKGGLSRTREWLNNWRRKNRHKKGVSKKFICKYGGVKISKKIYGQRYKALKKKGGPLPIKRIQMVYEDNIKKYGTLTCYLCENPILFSKDHLEHKTPLSRGGTNKYNNLGVACQGCNNRKSNKTEKEYREEIFNHGNTK